MKLGQIALIAAGLYVVYRIGKSANPDDSQKKLTVTLPGNGNKILPSIELTTEPKNTGVASPIVANAPNLMRTDVVDPGMSQPAANFVFGAGSDGMFPSRVRSNYDLSTAGETSTRVYDVSNVIL